MNRVITAAASLSMIVGVVGCSTEQFQSNLVSTHLAVLSVESFDSARRKLSPNFKLTGDDAVKLVNPTIGGAASSRLDSLRVGGELGVDITPDAIGLGDTEAPALPGSAPRPPVFSGPANFKDLLEQASPFRTSRILEYQLAQSLFEQVSMLNSTVAAAAIPQGYQGYIVQLQVAVMPRTQNLTADIYADIAFFSVTKSLDITKSRLAQQAQLGSGQGPLTPDSRRISIIPLLSTDSLESVVNSSSVDEVRAISGGLRAAASRVNLGVSAERILEQIQASLGKRLFSSYSVARLSENTLRARFGAVPDGSGASRAVPRTHKVPVLLLIPDDLATVLQCSCGKVELIASAKYVIVDPTTGEEGQAISFTDLVGEGMSRISSYFALPGGDSLLDGRSREDLGEVLKLAMLAQNNDYQGFLDGSNALTGHLKKRAKLPECDAKFQLIAEITPESLWLEMTNLVTKTQYAGARFTISPMPARLTAPKAVVAIDDEKTVTITLAGIPADRIRPNQVSLVMPTLGGKEFFPDSISEGAGGAAKLTFPSLKKFDKQASLMLSLPAEEFAKSLAPGPIPVEWISSKSDAKAPPPLLSSTSDFVNTPVNGYSKAVVVVNSKAAGEAPFEAFTLKMVGGSRNVGPNSSGMIVSPESAAKVQGNNIEILESCVITLDLTGLTPHGDLNFIAVDKKDSPLKLPGSTLTFRVQ
jgi:hypothetical protein